jgi:hypothetical protein
MGRGGIGSGSADGLDWRFGMIVHVLSSISQDQQLSGAKAIA